MVPQLRTLDYLEGGCEQDQQNYVSETQQDMRLTKTMLRHKKGVKDTVKARPSSQLCRPSYLGN